MLTPIQCLMARAGLRLSLKEVATAAACGVNTLSRFENDGNTSSDTIKRIQAALEAAGAQFVSEPGREGVWVPRVGDAGSGVS